MAKKASRKKAAGNALSNESASAVTPAGAVEVTLDRVVGQPRAIGVLRGAIDSKRVHHAWVFTGPSGVGKRTSALAFARELLLPADGHADRDAIDQQLSRGHHPDLHVVSAKLASVSRDSEIRTRKQTTLPREVVAEFLVEPATKTRVTVTSSVAAKVFVVVDAHMMGEAAQNLLLKTLEEPPDGTVIVLVTQNEDRLLPTIRSRCQRVAFGPLDKPEMESFADRFAPEMDDTQRFIALALAEGSPGRLQQVVAGGLVSWAQDLEPMFRAADAGRAVPELGPAMTDLVNAEATRQVGGDKLASKEAANRRAAADMLMLVAERHRRQLRRTTADPVVVERLAGVIEAVGRTEMQIASNVPLQHVFGLLAAELTGGRAASSLAAGPTPGS